MASLTAWAQVANEARNNHGGTYERHALPAWRLAGYWVGGKRPGIVLTDATPRGAFAEALAHFAAGLAEGEYVGLWFDNGLIYLDVVEWCAEYGTAASMARQRGELAVYACAAGREVRL